MATGSGGGGGAGGGGANGAAGGATGAGPGATAAAQGRASDAASAKAGDVEVLGADGKSHGVFNDGKPVAPNIRLESLDRSGRLFPVHQRVRGELTTPSRRSYQMRTASRWRG